MEFTSKKLYYIKRVMQMDKLKEIEGIIDSLEKKKEKAADKNLISELDRAQSMLKAYLLRIKNGKK